jgi:hypothetical protein
MVYLSLTSVAGELGGCGAIVLLALFARMETWLVCQWCSNRSRLICLHCDQRIRPNDEYDGNYSTYSHLQNMTMSENNQSCWYFLIFETRRSRFVLV